MDRIIKIALGLFVLILVSFSAFVGYTSYIDHAYRSSLSSTYTYSCTITTDSALTNVTLFVPVPADRSGNSPVIAQLSAQQVDGIPETWSTVLYETGKSTLVKITIPALVPPEGTGPDHPYSTTFSTSVKQKGLIDTKNPVENSPMFRPVQDLQTTACRDTVNMTGGGQCFTYMTSLYASYEASPDAKVSFGSSLTGRNAWTIFEPRANEYRTSLSLQMSGGQKGWSPVAGYLEEGIGAYDAPTRNS